MCQKAVAGVPVEKSELAPNSTADPIPPAELKPACGSPGSINSSEISGDSLLLNELGQWPQPNAPPRTRSQNTEDLEQGVVSVEPSGTGGLQLRVTLLAAGFVIGPAGASIRDVCRVTGAEIRSWTLPGDEVCTRPTRTFRVEGFPGGTALAAGILCDAVERYKELCEGAYAGQSVPRIQRIRGVDFCYQPPPRAQVPQAAMLKGTAGRRSRDRRGSGGAGGNAYNGGGAGGNAYGATGSTTAVQPQNPAIASPGAGGLLARAAPSPALVHTPQDSAAALKAALVALHASGDGAMVAALRQQQQQLAALSSLASLFAPPPAMPAMDAGGYAGAAMLQQALAGLHLRADCSAGLPESLGLPVAAPPPMTSLDLLSQLQGFGATPGLGIAPGLGLPRLAGGADAALAAAPSADPATLMAVPAPALGGGPWSGTELYF